MYLPEVIVRAEGEYLYVRSPYHPDFPEGAREKGGKWMGWEQKVWRFDRRLEQQIRDLLTRIYGWDGSYPVLIADVLVEMDRLPPEFRKWGELWMLGRMLARRRGWRAHVELGPGVSVKRGGFPGSGGNRKYPALNWEPGTVLRVLDVPVAKIEAVRGEYPEAIEEIPGTRRIVLGKGQAISAQENQETPREVTRRLLFPGEEG